MALGIIDESILAQPENLKNYFLRGGIHLSYGANVKSIRDFEKYLAYHPDDSVGMHNLGLA